MPFALPGALTVLFAPAAALCGSVTMPPESPGALAAVVQRDDAFVIVSVEAADPVAKPVTSPIRPASLKLGRAVQIDPDLLLARAPLLRGAAQ